MEERELAQVSDALVGVVYVMLIGSAPGPMRIVSLLWLTTGPVRFCPAKSGTDEDYGPMCVFWGRLD